MEDRKAYFLANWKSFFYLWLESVGLWCFVILVYASPESLIKVIALMLICIAAGILYRRLNSLVEFKDDRFMINMIFWFGTCGFGLITLAAFRPSIGNLLSVLGQGIFIVLVLGIILFWIPASLTYQTFYKQKTLD